MRVLGTGIKVENAKSDSNAFCFATVGANDLIEADVYSDEDISEGVADTITQAAHKP